MSQYTTGAITVANGATTATGTGTAWAANVAAGDMLVIGDAAQTAIVASVQGDTALTLEAPGWQGPTVTGAAYALNRDFDPVTGAPLMAYGAIRTDLIHNRAVAALSGAILRRTAGAVSPMSGGAAGDGVTPDTAVVQAAITAAAGGIVAIDRPYLINGTGLVVPPNTTLVGSGELIFTSGAGVSMGAGSKLLGLGLNGGPAAAGIVTVTGNDVELADFWGTPTYAIVSASSVARLKITHWRADNPPHAALVLDNLTDAQIESWLINNAGSYGIWLRSNCDGVQIGGGRVIGGGGGATDSAGVKLIGNWGGQSQPNHRIKLRDIIVKDSAFVLGVECWGGSTDVVADNISVTGSNGYGTSFDAVNGGLLSNITANGTGLGCEIAGSSNVTGTNITSIGCATALSCSTNGAPSSGLLLSGVQAINSSSDAVHIYSVQGVRLRGLSVTGSAGICVRAQGSVVDLRDSYLSTSSSANGSLVTADNASQVTVDNVEMRATGVKPTYGIQAVNGSVIMLGRLSGDPQTPQAVGNGTDGTDIRSLWGDSVWPTITPLNAALPGALSPSVSGGVYSSVRTLLDTGTNRIVRFKLARASGRQSLAHFTLSWGARYGDNAQGGTIIFAAASWDAVGANPSIAAIGAPVSWTQVTYDAAGYPYWDIVLPAGGAEMHVVVQAMGTGINVDPWLIYVVPDAQQSAGALVAVPTLTALQSTWDAFMANPKMPFLEADDGVTSSAFMFPNMNSQYSSGAMYQNDDGGVVIAGGGLNGAAAGVMVITSADGPVGHASGAVTVTAGMPGAGAVAGPVEILGGPGNSQGGQGGPVFLDGGRPVEGAGGDVWIRAAPGASTKGAAYRGGVVFIEAGDTVNGGNMGGGDIRMSSGNAQGDAAWISLVGGTSQTGKGGGISLTPGATSTGYANGEISLRSADGQPRIRVLDTVVTLDASLSAAGGTRIDPAGNLVRRAYILSTVPAPTTPGTEIYISDRNRPATADGSAWRWADGTVVS